MSIERSFNNSISEWKIQSKIEKNRKVLSLIQTSKWIVNQKVNTNEIWDFVWNI